MFSSVGHTGLNPGGMAEKKATGTIRLSYSLSTISYDGPPVEDTLGQWSDSLSDIMHQPVRGTGMITMMGVLEHKVTHISMYAVATLCESLSVHGT